MGAARKTERTRQWQPSAPSPPTATASPAQSTLALNVKAKLVRVENPSEKGPHFRIFASNVELGAAWQKTARDTERDYLSVKLDDPSFPAPIYATLIEVEGRKAFSSSGPGRTGTEGPPRQRPRRKAGPFLRSSQRLNRTSSGWRFCAALLLSLRPHGARLRLAGTDSSLQLLHRAAPLSLAPFSFRRVSSELMLSSTASKFGGSPKIMPCIAL